jgi:thioredoxin-like negative regulator of GroEL
VPQLPEHKSLSDSPLNLWLNQSDKQLVLVVFTADWAGSVAILKGFLSKIAEELPSGKIPSIIMLRDHEVVDHINGLLPRKKIAARMAHHL